MARKGRVSVETRQQRFDKKYVINEVTDCWEWTAACNNIGYGLFRYNNQLMRSAHRVSYEIHKGPIPQGMVVCHTCDNPKCVNPNHLWTGTRQDNSKDMTNKGRCGRHMLGKKHRLTTCNQCGKVGPVNIIARNHNDKCKNKP
jgi:hypothetical protein